jgi:hypothetical protein
MQASEADEVDSIVKRLNQNMKGLENRFLTFVDYCARVFEHGYGKLEKFE